MFCRMRHIIYAIRVFAFEWLQCWDVLRSQCVLESMDSKWILISCVRPIPALFTSSAEREQLLFILFIVQKAAILITLFVWSTTIADSCPWIITMLLMCESFLGYFRLGKYSRQRQCVWYLMWDYSMHMFHCQAYLSPIWHKNHNNNPGILCDTKPYDI